MPLSLKTGNSCRCSRSNPLVQHTTTAQEVAKTVLLLIPQLGHCPLYHYQRRTRAKKPELVVAVEAGVSLKNIVNKSTTVANSFFAVSAKYSFNYILELSFSELMNGNFDFLFEGWRMTKILEAAIVFMFPFCGGSTKTEA